VTDQEEDTMQRDAHRVSKHTRYAMQLRRTHDLLTEVPTTELRKGDSLVAPYAAVVNDHPRLEGDVVVMRANGREQSFPATRLWTVRRPKVAR
jgi:hypothetical protein